jgi:glycosyltransferase involved in cell wall biosynthesis
VISAPTLELPSVSIIVPTHGRPGQLAQCLSALAALDYPKMRLEVIVVDDGSPQPVDSVVEPFLAKINLRLLRCEHIGPAAARNRGAEEASGAVLAFTDDDCLPEPGWLRALVADVDGTDAAVGGRTLNPAPENVYATAAQAIVDWVYAFYNEKPDSPRFFASNNLAVPRTRFLELGGFDPRFSASEDRELCDRWRHQGLPLLYRAEARVAHATKLSLSDFARRHFGYGRGAYRFNAVRRDRRSGSLARDLPFYGQLPRRVAGLLRGTGPGRGAALAGLIVLWQVANLTGFVWESARSRLRRP